MKHPHTVARTKTGLIVVDLQEKFRPAIGGFEGIVENAVRLILTFQMFKMPILVTEQYPRGLGSTVGKVRSQFSLLEVIEKMELACGENAEFRARMGALALETVVVCGIETHVCINQTVLGLVQAGMNVHVVSDAVGSRKTGDHECALEKMRQAGAIVDTTEIVLFELAEKAGTQSFKNIQTMVKGRPVRSEASVGAESTPGTESVRPAVGGEGAGGPSALRTGEKAGKNAPGAEEEAAAAAVEDEAPAEELGEAGTDDGAAPERGERTVDAGPEEQSRGTETEEEDTGGQEPSADEGSDGLDAGEEPDEGLGEDDIDIDALLAQENENESSDDENAGSPDDEKAE